MNREKEMTDFDTGYRPLHSAEDDTPLKGLSIGVDLVQRIAFVADYFKRVDMKKPFRITLDYDPERQKALIRYRQLQHFDRGEDADT